jgi:Domain of unknown function (DUF4157)
MGGQTVEKVQRAAPSGSDPMHAKRSKSAGAPTHPILALQRTIGNEAVQRFLQATQIQAKLKVNEAGDKFEREADRTAETVMRAPLRDESVSPASAISRVANGSTQRAQDEDPQPVQCSSRSPLRQHPQPDEGFAESRSPLRQHSQPGEEFAESRSPLRQHPQLDGEFDQPSGPLQLKEDKGREEKGEMPQRNEAKGEMLQRKEAKEEKPQPNEAKEEKLQRKEAKEDKEEDRDEGAMVQRAGAEEDEEPVMTARTDRRAPAVPEGFASLMQRSSGEGSPVPDESRAFFESRFGADFGAVRIHTGSNANKLNRSIQAKAFTRANHIYFSDGAYDPSSTSGKTLLAHELTHVVQQGHAPPTAGASSPAASGAPGREMLQREESHAAAESESGPSEEERAAALAAAARARKEAEQAAAFGRGEIAKSKQQQEAEKKSERSANQKARAAGGQAKEAEEKAKKHTQKDEPAPKAGAIEEKEGAAAGAKEEQKAPSSPAEDPAFQKVVKKIGGVAKKQKTHAPAKSKAAEAQAAAKTPPEEITGRAENTHTGEMEKAETPSFDAVAFKKELLKRIEELAPKTLEEADNFKENNELASVKGEMSGTVAKEKEASRGPLEAKKAEKPDTKSVKPKSVTPIPAAAPGAPPPGVGASEAAPKTKTKGEIESPLRAQTQQIGDELATENITEEQLAKSNEPQFKAALSSKRSAEADAAAGPKVYRQFERSQLGRAEKEAAATAAVRTKGMHTGRAKAFGQVHGMQGQTKGKDEAARREVGQHIHGIYEQTKAEVERILSELDGKVERAFDAGAEAAKQAFESYVDAEMEAYKQERYGGWFGWARWGKDKLFGLPGEVNVFYEHGRKLYLSKMDAVIDNVVAIIGADLTAAKAEIAKGRKAISDYLAGLPASLKTVGAEAAERASDMFDTLEESVNNKQSELIDTLANKYHEHLKAVDARIEEMKEANRGLVDKAIDAVKGVIKTIIELKNLLFRVLAKIADVVLKIIADPIGFLKNLIAGIRLGLNNFLGKIAVHLQAGFIGWLTGALSSVRLQMPEDVFSPKGIFSIVTQVLGLTWDYVRGKAVKLLGEPVVKALETGFTIFQVLVKEGPAGLWEYAKAEFADLKEMVIDQIKEMLITQVIKAGIKWLMGLLSPVGAFIKAAMAIYDIVSFFMQKAKQIFELIEAFVDAVAAVAKGSIAGAAKLIEGALAKALPLIIGFLASLLGIGGLADKVKKLFMSLRKRVDKFIDGVLLRARKFAMKLQGKRGAAANAEAKELSPNQVRELIISELKKPPTAKDPAQAIAETRQLAESLKAKYQPKLKSRTIKITLLDQTAEGVAKDGDIDIDVALSPGTKVSRKVSISTYLGASRIGNSKNKFKGSFSDPQWNWNGYPSIATPHPANLFAGGPNGTSVPQPTGDYKVAGNQTKGNISTLAWRTFLDAEKDKEKQKLLKSGLKKGVAENTAKKTLEQRYNMGWVDLRLQKQNGGWDQHHIHPINWGGKHQTSNMQYLRRAEHQQYTGWWSSRKADIIRHL